MECVPRYFESGEIDKFTYLITEYVDEPFSQFFNMLDFPQRMTVYAQILGYVESIHATGIAHREIKPENFKVKDGYLYLTNFISAQSFLND